MAGPPLALSTTMDIRFEFTGQERDAALSALVTRDQRDATLLLTVMIGGAMLSLVWPFAEHMTGPLRGIFGALSAALVFCIMRQGMLLHDQFRRYRAGLPMDPGYLRGLEPGARTVTLTLESVRERGPYGARALPWSAITGIVEDEHYATLIVSPGECVILPKWALERAGYGDLEIIAMLVQHARRR